MTTRREWILLALALVVVLAAVEVYRSESEEVLAFAEAAQTGTKNREPRRMGDVGELDLSQPRRVTDAGETADIFAGKSWHVPPPPPSAAESLLLASTTAPPLPFTYLGSYEDREKPVIFLVSEERVLVVSVGDVIESTYRVDGLVGTALNLTYLPLKIRQSLDIGSGG
jgi:hypothetical protein